MLSMLCIGAPFVVLFVFGVDFYLASAHAHPHPHFHSAPTENIPLPEETHKEQMVTINKSPYFLCAERSHSTELCHLVTSLGTDG